MNAETTNTVHDFVQQRGISMNAAYVDRITDADGWEHDAWKCVLIRRETEVYSFRNERGDLVNGHKDTRRQMTVNYRMGTGHHGAAPRLIDVLDSIASDAAGVEDARDFETWASDYGYDPDSRKAERIYRACQRETTRLKKFLGDEAYNTLLWETERL
jgi:hypothetical protein